MRSLFGLRLLFGWLTVGYRFLPVIVGRIMLSLRKAADVTLGDWSLAELSTNDRSVQSSVRFGRPSEEFAWEARYCPA